MGSWFFRGFRLANDPLKAKENEIYVKLVLTSVLEPKATLIQKKTHTHTHSVQQGRNLHPFHVTNFKW